MEKETEKQNLGSGSIPGLMIKLAVPTIIAQLVNLLYNLVDRIYIGHIREVGDIALTGLGLCFPVLMMVTAFAMLIGSGGAPRAAIYMGKGDNETADKSRVFKKLPAKYSCRVRSPIANSLYLQKR